MSRTLPSPDRLFDRLWQPGHPMRPRLSRVRRWGMLLLLVVLCTLIGGYWYWTDAARVREMAEEYLTRLVGGPVKVQGASLSIFEGLRLDDVEVYVDDPAKPDSLIFSAKTLYVEYDLHRMLRRELRATQIRAIDPRVRFVEDTGARTWNFQRLDRPRVQPPQAPSDTGEPIILPEVLLRNARVEYGELRAGRISSVGAMTIEGRLTPGKSPGQYEFDLQSRGRSEGMGPVISGWVDLDAMKVSARMRNFEFGSDIRAMVPAIVRDWWEQHGLSGRINVPSIQWEAGRDGSSPKFRVETDLESVTLTATAEEWRTRDQQRRAEALSWMLRALRGAHRGAVSRPATEEGAYPSRRSFYDHLAAHFDASPVELHKVSGTFIFTETGIDIRNLTGRIETNAIEINGRVDGYTPQSPARVRISSVKGENIYVPPSPKFVGSMPEPVREIYERLRPVGTCAFSMEIVRAEPGGPIEVSGAVEVLDGNFVFDRFPYPLRRATGRITIGRDPKTGIDVLTIDNLSGLGVIDGPNRDARVTVNGIIGPLGPEAGVSIRVTGKGIENEPALRAAFPRDVRRALKSMDATGTGEKPQFRANFTCDILRPIGIRRPWTVNTDIELLDASGALSAFPYPLSGLRGWLRIRDDYVKIENLSMTKGDASLVIDGKVSWHSHPRDSAESLGEPTPVPLRPELTITARSVPIDAQLIAAIPESKRKWVEKLGLGGTLDIDGRVFPVHETGDEVDVDLDIRLRNVSAWPKDGTFAVSDMSGTLHLTGGRLELIDIAGRREEAKVGVSGLIEWPDEKPRLALNVSAEGLALDTPLYQLLPRPAQEAWDALKPEGRIDLKLGIKADDLENQPIALGSVALEIVPRGLSITPRVVPYRLDDLGGKVTLSEGTVTLHDLTGKHEGAKISLAGTGSLRDDGQWSLAIGGRDVPVDEPLLRALPVTLSDLIRSVEMKGNVDFDLTKFVYRPAEPKTGDKPKPATAPATTQSSPADIDFALRLVSHGASLDVGVPLSDVVGTATLEGQVLADEVGKISGGFEIESMKLAHRTVRSMKATINKPGAEPILRLQDMQAELAGGDLAGAVELHFGETTQAGYALELVLRGADVRELAGEMESQVSGELSASLSLSGRWNDARSRRGRGDVAVSGRNMYRIPMVLGLLQITNLSLPITKPFSNASSRYSLDGQRVTLETIQLRSDTMSMDGYGYIDFADKQVRLTLNTDDGNWDKLPIVGDLLRGAKQELLQIHVRGTLEEPKVEAKSFNTFQTTVDEVLQGD